MRYAMIFFIVCCSIQCMEQPPQTLEKMKISPQVFEQESKRGQSYLSLLPADVTQLVRQHAYAGLSDVITVIRNNYLADSLKRDLFLYNSEFNREIIEKLVERFKLPALGKFNVGLELNTPASFKIASEIFTPDLEQYLRNIIAAFTQYIQNSSLSYKDTIDYTRGFLNNVRELLKKSHLRELQAGDQYPYIIENNKKAYTQNWIPYFINTIITVIANKFIDELEKEKARIPEVRVAFDLGDNDMQQWIKRLIQIVYDHYHDDIPNAITHFKNKNFGIQSALLGSITNPLGSPNILLYDQFKTAVCNDLADLLTKVLHDNEHEKILFLFKLVILRNGVAFPTCVEERIQGTLGVQLVEYLIKNNFPKTIVSELYGGSPFTYLLILQLINRAHATPESVLQFIKVVNLVLKFKRHDFSRDDINLLRIQQDLGSAMILSEMRQSAITWKYGIQILLAVVKSSNMNEAVLNAIIANGADINGADEQGITILMHAIKSARIDFVRILLEQKDINKNVCDTEGHNALWYAEYSHDIPFATRRHIIQLLEQAGVTEGEACVIQ